MRLIRLSIKNMLAKPLGTVLSLGLIMLSVAIAALILQLNKQVQANMSENTRDVDMVVGAKGSPLQLVLSSVLHIDNPTGNILLEETKILERNPLVASTVPVSYGDNYEGFRIVGTIPDFFEFYKVDIDDPNIISGSGKAVVGHTVANLFGLKVGDTFVGSHGLVAESIEAHDEHPYTVVQLLEEQNSVIDQLLITSLESIWDAHSHEHGEDHGDDDNKEDDHDDHDHDDHDDHDHEGHDHDDHEHDDHEGHDHDDHEHDDHDGHDHDDHEHDDHEGHEHEANHDDHEHDDHEEHDHDDHEHDDHEAHDHEDEPKEITSLLVKFRNPMGAVTLPRMINEKTNMQAAVPKLELDRLFGFLGIGVQTLSIIALAILLVSGFSIFINLYKAIRERKAELALMRTYGASTMQLLFVVGLEGILLGVVGFICGILVSRIGLLLLSSEVTKTYGYSFDLWNLTQAEMLLFVSTLAVAILGTFFASLSIFKMNVSKILSDD